MTLAIKHVRNFSKLQT